MSKSNRKTHGRTARVERAGVLHCARVVNEMKHVWRERPISDVGIDGDIEIVEPATETPTGRFLLVQVKARSAVDQDASGNLKFRCTAADLEYWLNVGVPVLLVIVDVEASQAWFKNVHEWFNGDIARRRSRNVVFHPTEDRFDASAADRLLGWAVAESGLYMGPAPQPETLFSNLLAVEHRSDSVFVAPTKVRRWRDANDRLREAGLPPVHDIAWRDGLLWSFRPLDRPPLIHLVEGAMDRLATDELETSHADDDQRLLVRLLGGTLKELHRSDLREDERHRYLYFRATQDLAAWRIKVGQRGGKGREVFGPRLDQETGTRPVYYRHSAVEHQFLLLEEGTPDRVLYRTAGTLIKHGRVFFDSDEVRQTTERLNQVADVIREVGAGIPEPRADDRTWHLWFEEFERVLPALRRTAMELQATVDPTKEGGR